MKENGFSRFLIKKAAFYRHGLGDKNCKEQSDGIASICERHAFRTVLSFDLGKAMQKKAKKIADKVGVFLLLIG